MNPWVMIGSFAVAVAVLWLTFSTGRDAGLAEGEQLRSEAVAKKVAEMAALEIEHSKQLIEFKRKQTSAEKQADEKIRKLLSENAELKIWWEYPIPASIAEYAWGVYDNAGNSAVPGRPVVVITNTN